MPEGGFGDFGGPFDGPMDDRDPGPTNQDLIDIILAQIERDIPSTQQLTQWIYEAIIAGGGTPFTLTQEDIDEITDGVYDTVAEEELEEEPELEPEEEAEE